MVYYDASFVLASQIANEISDMGFNCEVIEEVNSPGEVTVQVNHEFLDEYNETLRYQIGFEFRKVKVLTTIVISDQWNDVLGLCELN